MKPIKHIAIVIVLFFPTVLLAQDEKYFSRINMDLFTSLGFSYGIQSISIPPFQNKWSLGLLFQDRNFEGYILPGFTGGIAPSSSFHFETGLKYRFITFDHSYNQTKIGNITNKFRNHNVNLGLMFKLNRKKSNNLSLWIKAGKSIQEKGYDNEHPALWNGLNMELKFTFNIHKFK